MIASQVEEFVILLIAALSIAIISRRLSLPYTIVLVTIGLLGGIIHIAPGIQLNSDTVLFLFLPILLFEGAWNLELPELRKHLVFILLLAIPGLLIGFGIVALLLHTVARLSWFSALLISAILSPTDPVAVIALLRSLHMPNSLRTIVEGESLLNDGVGAVVYQLIVLLFVAANGVRQSGYLLQTIGSAIWLAVGGVIIGVAIGLLCASIIRRVSDPLIEIALTLAIAYGSFLAAELLHTSGLLAVVMSGIVLGRLRATTTFSPQAQHDSAAVWDFLSYLANSILFLLAGLQIGALSLIDAWPAIVLSVTGVIIGRGALLLIALGFHELLRNLRSGQHVPIAPEHSSRHSGLYQRAVKNWPVVAAGLPKIPLTWFPILLFSGLRGAVSLALVLATYETIPASRNIIAVVYGVIFVTLVGQGIGLHFSLTRWQYTSRT